jgi:hypothetical protein
MIADKPTGFYFETSTQNFEKQVAYLAKNYRVVSLNELVERVRERRSLRGCVAITFDDGFRDNYENAYPILKKYNVPATIFLTTSYIEDGSAPWFIKLRYIFMKTEKTDFQLRINHTSISLPMRTSEEKFTASDKVMACLKKLTNEGRISLLDRLCEDLGVIDFQELDNLMLSWDQVKQMSENSISFGAHTISHPILTRMSLDKVENEIRQSKEMIKRRIGKPVSSFAYPFGKRAHYSSEFFPILQKLQFNCAVTTEIGANSYKTNLFEFDRPAWEQFMNELI